MSLTVASYRSGYRAAAARCCPTRRRWRGPMRARRRARSPRRTRRAGGASSRGDRRASLTKEGESCSAAAAQTTRDQSELACVGLDQVGQPGLDREHRRRQLDGREQAGAAHVVARAASRRTTRAPLPSSTGSCSTHALDAGARARGCRGSRGRRRRPPGGRRRCSRAGTAARRLVPERRLHALRRDHGAERDVARGQSLRARHQVGLDAVALAAEPGARAGRSRR